MVHAVRGYGTSLPPTLNHRNLNTICPLTKVSSKDGLGRGGGQQISFNRDKDGLIGYPERMFVLTMSRIEKKI